MGVAFHVTQQKINMKHWRILFEGKGEKKLEKDPQPVLDGAVTPAVEGVGEHV